MATITETNELDVLCKYKELLHTSLSGDSVYIRTKETLQEMFANSDMTSREKSDILSQVLTSLNTALVNASMGTALQWSEKEKDVALKKLELAKQLDILDNQILLTEEQKNKTMYEAIEVQAQTRRMYGIPTVTNGVLTALTDEGKMFYDTIVSQNQGTNLSKEALILDSKLNESFAAIHKVVADTYANYGNYTYTMDSTGVTSVTDGTPAGHITLSSIQAEIAKGQANGYTYNGWANALTGTASMLGTAIASELTAFGPGSTGETLITNANNLVTKFSTLSAPY